MGRITLNPKQREASETFDRNMVVRAGAGCGKTATLVWRYINILKQGLAEVGEIAAITFTEKAANELKGRIHDQLRALFEAESPGPGRNLWRRRLWAAESAHIGTIHGFCTDILREFPIQAGVAPGFAMAERSDAAELVSKAARDAVFDAVTAGDASAVWAVERFGLDRLVSMLEAAISKRERIASALDGFRSDSSAASDLAGQLRKCAAQGAAALAVQRLMSKRFTKAVSVLESHPGPPKDVIELKRAAFIAAYEASLSSESNDIADTVNALAGVIGNLRGGSGKLWGSGPFKKVKAALKMIRDILSECKSLLTNVDGEDWPARALEMERFIGLHNAAVAKYREAKRARGVLDFDDLLIKTRDLLRDNPDVAALVAGYYRFILVDEFQDTDHVQAEIIRALTSPGAGGASGRANLFVVGDAEQSIYRFRGAEVEVFSGLRADYQKSGEGEATTLAGNYRSLPHILGFVNVLFGRLIHAGSGGVGSPASHTPLEAKRGRGTPGGGRVEIILARSARKGDMTRARQAEARVIASRVKEIISTGIPPVWEKGDDSGEVPRPPRLGDIAVLLRSMSSVEVYERALRDAGIPYHTVAGSTFYKRQEVKDLVNLLRFVVDSDDTLSLAGALRSPLFAVSDDLLAQLARSAFLNDYFDGLEPDAPETADLAAFRRAVDLVGRLRLVKDRVPVRTIIDIILDETGFPAALSMLYSGDRRTRNVYRLRDAAAAFDASGQGGLLEFVRRVGALEQKEERESEAILEKDEADVVRIMTVHAAKGLEFPIVIVADMGRQRAGGGSRRGAGLLVDRRLGLALPALDDETGAYRTLVSQIDKACDDAEEKRIFFVAATRARDHLILSGAVSGSGPGAPKGWAKDVLDALEIDLDEPGDYPFDGFTVEYSTPGESILGARRSRGADLSRLQESLVAGEAISGDSLPNEDALAAHVEDLGAGFEGLGIFTATAIADFSRCPLRYEFVHLRRLPGDWILEDRGDGRVVAGHVIGTLLHEVLEKARGTEPLADVFNRIIHSRGEYARNAGALRAECLPILSAFEQSRFYKRLSRAGGERELSFSMILGDFILEGKIDRYAPGEIIDFKSDSISADEVPLYAEGYRAQMDVYALAAWRLTGRAPERVTLYFLRPGVEVNWDYANEGLAQARGRVLAAVEAIRKGPPYAARPEDDCRCEYKNLCRVIAARRSTRV